MMNTENLYKLSDIPESDSYMQAVLDNSTCSIWGVNRNLHLVFFNHHAKDFFKLTINKTLIRDALFTDFIQPERRQIWEQHLRQALQNDSFIIFDTIAGPNGEIYLEINFKPVSFNGQVIGVVCQAIDITEQKMREINLFESEEKFRKVFNDAYTAISIQTKNQILLVNKTWEAITGYSAIEAQNLMPIELVHPNERYRINQIDFDRLGGSEMPENYEFHLLTKDKKEKWIDLHTSQIIFEGQKAVLLVGNDITQKKETNKLVQKLSTAVTNSPTSIVITDKNAQIEYVNPYFSSFTGYSFDEAVGQDPKILKSGNTPIEVYQDMWTTLLAKKVWAGEFENKKKNGDLYWESARIAPLLDEKGEITHFIAVKEDITNLKNSQKRLEASKKELLELNAKKDKFFSIIAHDLRSPFLGLLNLTQLLHDNFTTLNPDKTRKFLYLLNESAQNVFQLLENLLEWSKTQTGRMEYKPLIIKLSDLINESLQLIHLNAQNKEITIEGKIDDNIFLFADKNMLQTIIRNLLGNAIKYTPKGGTIYFEAAEVTVKPEMVAISIKDTGIGIPVEKQSKIFKIGENYSTPGTEAEKGTGLGLIICKEFVEYHGGRIWCDSDGTNGTTFTFTIPVAK